MNDVDNGVVADVDVVVADLDDVAFDVNKDVDVDIVVVDDVFSHGHATNKSIGCCIGCWFDCCVVNFT